MTPNYLDMTALELLALAPPGWGGLLLHGLAVSLQVAVCGYLLGLAIGLAGASAKRSGGPITRDLLAVYTTVVRAIPELVLILLAYFAMPKLINQGLSYLDLPGVEIGGFTAGVAVIGFVQGAYATEVFRGAMATIPRGNLEAAHSFGMHPWRIYWRITVPEMIPAALPGLSNLWLIATKDTALLAVVGFTELSLASRQAAGATKRQFLFLAAAGALYLMVTLLSQLVFRLIERSATRGLRHG